MGGVWPKTVFSLIPAGLAVIAATFDSASAFFSRSLSSSYSKYHLLRTAGPRTTLLIINSASLFFVELFCGLNLKKKSKEQENVKKKKGF